MGDAEAMRKAGEQFNRLSWSQLREAGLSADAIGHRVQVERLVVVHDGVFAFPPVLDHDPWGRWSAATLTSPGSVLSGKSSAVARGVLSFEGPLTTITRPGTGGTRRFDEVLVHHSERLDGDTAVLEGIPITTFARTLIDMAGDISEKALKRAVREGIRLGHTSLVGLGDALGRYRGWRGVRELAATVASYSGLPIERARSGAEVRALELLRDARRPMPRLNTCVAGEEADLSWPAWRLIVEIDGEPFHRDVGEDARKEGVWRDAGWDVRRVPSDDVYERPRVLLEGAQPPTVHRVGA